MKKINKEIIDSMIDFLRKESLERGFQKVVVGLSGGIDSAVVALLCKLAFCIDYKTKPDFQIELKKDNVKTILMPSLTSSQESIDDALELCKKFKLNYEILDIKDFDRIFCEKYPNADNLARGNFCARMRMATLYYISQVEKRLVIGTSNKSELMLGYGTLFGDLACALNPIGNLYKTQIFDLAQLLDVPDSILKKPPSADLYQGQSDEKEIGYSYKEIDEFLESYEKYEKEWSKFIKKKEEGYRAKDTKRNDVVKFLKKEFNLPDLTDSNKKDKIIEHKLKKDFDSKIVENLYGRIRANAFKQNPTKIFKFKS